MKCPECDDPMELIESPRTIFSISIPFTSCTIEIWYWGAKEFQCGNCLVEISNRRDRDLYDAGAEYGYLEGRKEGRG